MAKFLVTSALPYAEGIMHLGNFVGSILPADVYYKYLTMKGDDAIFICGSDQHGTPTEIKALERGISPERLSDGIHDETKKLLDAFGCTFTHYGKTHTETNKVTVHEIFAALSKNGFITETSDMMAYCDIDKRFLPDRFIEGTCPHCKKDGARGDQCDSCGHLLDPEDLIRPYCRICGNKELEFRPVRNLALDLKKLQPRIEAFIKASAGNGWSKNAYNKASSYLKEGLKPRDITRSLKWGFPVPAKGFEGSVFYVWFDAIIGYIGITREWSKEWKRYWTDRDRKLVQFMGKDNIEFHTLVEPGILLGSDLGYILPHTIRASEFLTTKGLKFSKSRGVGLNIQNSMDILPPDYWRFTLMYLYPETADTEFTIASLSETVNNIMNDKIGNFVHRVLTLFKNNVGIIGEEAAVAEEFKGRIGRLEKEYEDNFDRFALREALSSAVALADYGNEIMSAKEPWLLVKRANEDDGSAAEFSRTMHALLRIARDLGVLLWPFVPHASARILSYFGTKQATLDEMKREVRVEMREQLRPVFSKITERELKLLEKFAG